jgi:hypothetical protein
MYRTPSPPPKVRLRLPPDDEPPPPRSDVSEDIAPIVVSLGFGLLFGVPILISLLVELIP